MDVCYRADNANGGPRGSEPQQSLILHVCMGGSGTYRAAREQAEGNGKRKFRFELVIRS
jgi:hypothetical protein